MQICFVCEGNTCRSPFAEKLFSKMLKQNNILGIKITSCGINSLQNSTTSPQTLNLLKSYGINFKGKKAQKLTKSKLDKTNLFITMTKTQKQYVPAKNVFSLGELVGGDDVLDPYGKDYEAYLFMAKKVYEYLQILLNKIKNIKEMQWLFLLVTMQVMNLKKR